MRTIAQIQNAEVGLAPSVSDVSQRWDRNAAARSSELFPNNDPAYRALTNLMLAELSNHRPSMPCTVLDIGCGVGSMSFAMADHGYRVTAIDPSSQSIEEAVLHSSQAPGGAGVDFEVASLEKYADEASVKFSVLVANMTLHCTPSLTSFFEASERLLEPGGSLLVTIPNPRTYLQTREDLADLDVDMSQSVTLDLNFRIRNHEPHPDRVYFFHRPVRDYAIAASAVGLNIIDFYDPIQVGPGRPRDITFIAFGRSASSRA